MQNAMLLRVNKHEAVMQLPKGGIIFTTLNEPAPLSDVSPLQPQPCEVLLGTYNLWKKQFENSSLSVVPNSSDKIDAALPVSQRMMYRKTSRARTQSEPKPVNT